MKKILSIAGAAGVFAIAAGFAATTATSSHLTSGDPSSHPLRAVAAAVVRNVLDFRQETPLSSSQRQQIATILSSHRSEIRAQAGRGRDARRAMFDAIETAGPTSPNALAAADQVGQEARDRALLMARIGSEIKPVLTPEQLSRVRSALQEVEAAVDTALAK